MHLLNKQTEESDHEYVIYQNIYPN